ncbi:MAG TPA: ABC transporter ATP-binding protein [Candidatus Nanopelagicaceae bacterium]|nr:ABC transporter ATP-binding protein [Candidatus Nanopelagicaceae bacterium]
MALAISVRNLNVDRSKKPILKDITLNLPAGQVYGLLGPNGSGKTTLLRTIMGLQRIASGDVDVLGKPAGDKYLRSRIGYSTQSASVYSDMTCLENIDFFKTLYPKTSRSAQEMLRQFRLEDHSNQMASTLSGGQRTLLALITSLVGNPELLILDEPTVGIDLVLRRELWAFLKTLTAGGMTVVVTSHVMDDADNCDDLILLQDGQVLAQGTPSSLREKTGEKEMEDVFISLVGEK